MRRWITAFWQSPRCPAIAAIFALLIWALAGVFWLPASSALGIAIVLSVIGGGLLGMALWRVPAGMPNVIQAQDGGTSNKVRWRWVLGGLALLWLLAEINGAILQQSILRDAFTQEARLRLNIHLQMLLLIGGLGGVIGGLLGKMPALFTQSTPRLRQSMMLAMILVLAFGVRVWNLEHEVHTFIDEMSIVESINALNRDPNTFLLTAYDQIAAFPWVWSYGASLASNTLGANLWALRLQSAIFGTLTVAALYLLARRLFDVRVALVAALLLATFPPHVHFSRNAMLLIASPAAGTLALYFAVRAAQTQTRRDFVLCGALLGWLNYYDESGRLVFPLLILLWYGWLWLMGRRTATRAGIGWLLLTALLVMLPIIYTRIGYSAPLFPRLIQNQTGDDFDWLTLLLTGNGTQNLARIFNERLFPPFLHYIHLPDTSEMYYGGSTALVLPYLVPFLLAGIAHCVWRIGAGGFLLIVWVMGVAAGNSLILQNTWSARYMGAAPVLMLLVAIGIVYTLRLIGTPFATRQVRQMALAGLALVLAFSQVVYYFGVHLPEYRQTIPTFPDYVDVAYRAADLPRIKVFFVYSDITFVLHFAPLFEWWGANVDLTYMPWWELDEADLAALPDSESYAFFVDPDDTATWSRLMRRFRWLPTPEYSPYNIPRQRQYLLYWLRPTAHGLE